MRLPMIAGNWKMNTKVSEAVALVVEMLPELEKIEGVDKLICPPYVSLHPISQIIKGSSVKLGAQNVYCEEKGAFTGEISPLMLTELCDYVIIGHSERRHIFGESGETVNKKVKAALEAGLRPILCVGERLEENEAGRTEEVLTGQLNSSLVDVTSLEKIIIAYEPVWAIGTGKAATDEQANETVGLVRCHIAQLFNRVEADTVRILYGGSVTASNIAELMGKSEIDGGLVGGASLKATEFISIIKQTSEIYS